MQGVQLVEDGGLGERVEIAGRVVEQEHRRPCQECPRQRDPLPLTARQTDPAVAEDGVVPVRQGGDEVVRLGRAGGCLHVLGRGVRSREGDVSLSVPEKKKLSSVALPTIRLRDPISTSSTGTPATSTLPPPASRRRSTRASRVDLPEPVIPSTATVPPAGTSRSTPSRIGSPAGVSARTPRLRTRGGCGRQRRLRRGSFSPAGASASSTRLEARERRLGRPSVRPTACTEGTSSHDVGVEDREVDDRKALRSPGARRRSPPRRSPRAGACRPPSASERPSG